MSKYNQYLIKFMEAKARLINQTQPDITLERYFNKRDRQSILRWKDADSIWKAIVFNITKNNAQYLSTHTCPFCFKYYNDGECKGCTYAGHGHKKCEADNSDWSIAISATEAITNAVYKDMIKTILLK